MRRTVHMQLSIRGALMNWSERELRNCFRKDDGSYATAQEAKAYLTDQLAMGRELLPIGDCEGFDYKTGCPGHVIEDEPQKEEYAKARGL